MRWYLSREPAAPKKKRRRRTDPPRDRYRSSLCHPYCKCCHFMSATLRSEGKRCTMQSMNISLPDQLKEFVDEQVGSGRYSS